MRQLVQYQKTGVLSVEDVPVPTLRQEGVIVHNVVSLISTGTERSSVSTAQASLIGKARLRPDLVQQVLENVRREGLMATYEKVQNRLDHYKALGYSSAGVVLETACDEFQVGDRVACAGEAYHAEIVAIPKNLCARIPDCVDFEAAAFTTLGAIALHGIRQADVRLGENVVVIGLGLVGLLTVQVLKAAGCQVLGVDLSSYSLEVARMIGADAVALSEREGVEEAVRHFTGERGADAVILTASTTSNEPLEMAAAIARDRGRLVIVGMVKADLPRTPFYEKELEVRISRSYGPGRYDPTYEEKGIDYPIGYVRWTEQRNMEAFLSLLAEGKVNVQPLITHRFPMAEAEKAYEVVLGRVSEPSIGVVLTYPEQSAVGSRQSAVGSPRRVDMAVPTRVRSSADVLKIGFIGAGNFAQLYLLPRLKGDPHVQLEGVVTSSGITAMGAAKKFGFRFATTDPSEVLEHPDIRAVFIVTRHNSHAHYVIQALERGKDVYVEKPLALNEEELAAVQEAYGRSEGRLMVGFNRRFSPLSEQVRAFFSPICGDGLTGWQGDKGPESHSLTPSPPHPLTRAPLVIHLRINAGALPANHWAQDPEVGGGRIVGEGCHFLDLARFWIGHPVVSVSAHALPVDGHPADCVCATLSYADGSLAVLEYLANGDRSVPKEYYEVHGGGQSAVLDDFRRLILAHGGKRRTVKGNGEKGHGQEMAQVVEALRTGQGMPIPFAELVETTRASFAVMESLRTGSPVRV